MPYADKEKQREYQRQWMANRRAEFFTGKACVQCDSTDRLELDHIDRQVKVSHNIWSWSRERREAEIAKCQVLCHDCHREKTNGQIHEWLSLKGRTHCNRGHDLAVVGVYHSSATAGGNCRYCQHIDNARLRGGAVRSLSEWLSKNN